MLENIIALLALVMLLMIPPPDEPENDSGRKNPELYRKLKNASKKRQWQDRRENRFDNPPVKDDKNPKKPP
ncbi:hypothetical protein [Candidatus Enterococcus clewellii]|uniref:Uncharacterized protein n=1 Tax=Candidatus Enterococcus clewellii TaxID=1834193 RepID=A0A242K3K9_9ENTE|nr:hypothetical protein [Enterococcus sp. 9E7_DIV0242]OTP12795.1 hypothetical protein A5888_003374 [Enterococcus sp. 9E7_DIV0242]